MGFFDPLKDNQPIEIEIPDDETNSFRSKVKAVCGDKLTVDSPVKGRSIIPLHPGMVVKITYTDNAAIYTFITEVISQNRKEPATLVLGKPLDVKRLRRRNFVRLDTKLTVVLTKLDRRLVSRGETFSGTVVDISGGGLMFRSNTLLECGETLEAEVYLDHERVIRAIGRVVRVMQNLPPAGEKFSSGFEFTMIEETERDKIIQFIFNQQRELRRRGLL